MHLGGEVPEISEVSLRQFIESTWFKGLSRGAMILCTVILAGFATTWAIVAGNTSTRVEALELTVKQELPAVKQKVEGVSDTLAIRAKDSEAFQQEVRDSVADLKASQRSQRNLIIAMQADVNETKVAVGVIQKLLQDRSDVAVTDGNPFPLAAVPHTQPGR